MSNTVGFNAKPATDFFSGTSFDLYPQQLGDINGDGRADAVWFHGGATYYLFGQADGTFGPYQYQRITWGLDPSITEVFNSSNGYWSFDRFPRQLGDINGDGLDDIVGFGAVGTHVSLARVDANGVFSFSPAFTANDFFGSDGFYSFDQFPRQLGDINGDGRADIVGFHSNATYYAFGQADGTFSDFEYQRVAWAVDPSVTEVFNSSNGWTSFDRFPRHLADVDGDGLEDIVGFAGSGTYVSLARVDANGSFSFEPAYKASSDFGQNQYSSFDAYPRQVADVNGDNRADVVVFGDGEIVVALGQADGTFGSSVSVAENFSNRENWTSYDRYPRQLADVNGDGRADLVGFSDGTTYVGISEDSSSNQAPTLSNTSFNINEHSFNGTAIGNLAAQDPDGDILEYEIVDGNDKGIFAIDKDSGTLTVANYHLLDYETETSHELKVSVKDAFNDAISDVTIHVNDISELKPSDNANDIVHLNSNTPHGHNWGDSVIVPINAPETNVTHEMWFRTADATTGLFSITDNSWNGAADRSLYLHNGQLFARTWSGSGSHAVSGGSSLNDGQWHHVAHVLDGASGWQSLYIDGQLVSSGAGGVSGFNWDTTARIGYSNDIVPSMFGYNWAGNEEKFFRGDIDEVRIWNKPLTQAEIQQRMSQTLNGDEANLLGYWSFDNGSGDDKTANNNHATIAKLGNQLQARLYDGSSLFTGTDLTHLLGTHNNTIEWHSRQDADAETIKNALVVGDFDGDGKDDVISRANYRDVLFSNGDGTFTKKGQLDAGFGLDYTNLIVGDFNGDGKDDIIRPRDRNVYFSNGEGKFNFAGSLHSWFANEPHNLVVGDFNGDGKDDFIYQQRNASNAYLYFSNGNGSFTGAAQTLNSYGLYGDFVNIVVGDFDGDGNDDFIRQEKFTSGGHYFKVYFSNGNGSFTDGGDFGLNWIDGEFTDLIVLDSDGDGKDDFIVREKGDWADSSQWHGLSNAKLYRSDITRNGGTVSGSFERQDLLQANQMKGYHQYAGDEDTNLGSAVIAGDFDGDGKDGFIIQNIPTLIDYRDSNFWDDVTGLADAAADAASDIADTAGGIVGSLVDAVEDAAEAAGNAGLQALNTAIDALTGDWWLKYFLEYIPSPYKKSNGSGHTINMVGAGVAYGEGGDDEINAYAVAAWLHGGNGDDEINSYSGASFIHGDSGNDDIEAYGGVNYIEGGSGNDNIQAYGGANAVLTGDGSDTVNVAGLANAVYSKGGDNETIYGAGGGNLFIKTGAGSDTMTSVGAANFMIKTASGNSDMIAGGGGNVMFKNGSGNDLMVGIAGANLMVKNGSGSSKMFAGGLGNLITSWGDSQDIIGAAAVGNAIISGAGDDIVIAAGKGNIAFGDSLGNTVNVFEFNPAGQALGTIGSLLDKVKLGHLDPKTQIENALDFLKGSSAGNDTMVTLGKVNVGVGGNGHDIMVAGGVSNFVFGDDLLDIADDLGALLEQELNDILGKVSFPDTSLPDLGFDFDLTDWTNNFQFSTPDFSGFGFSFSAPSIDFSLPSFSLPDLSSYLPSGVSLPDIDLSSINLNDLLTLPSFSLPDLSDFGISDLTSRFDFDFYSNNGDILFAAGKTNVIAGGAGSDITISAGKQNYVLSGTGNDLVLSAGKENQVFGNDGNDLVFAGGNKNDVKGGNNDDTLVTAGQTNTVDGDAGVDILLGIGNDDTLNGGADNDVLIGVGVGRNSTLNGEDGNDILLAGGQNNTFNGGAGDDKYYLDGLLQQGVTTIDNEGGGNDRLIFAPTILNTSQLSFARSSSDLAITVNFGTYANQVTVKDWFSDATKEIDLFEVNGSAYTLNDSLSLVAVV